MELLTAFTAKNMTHNKKHPDSKTINIADRKTCKRRLFAVEYLILIIYNDLTATTSILYTSTDGTAVQPADNLPNLDRLGDSHRTLLELKL